MSNRLSRRTFLKISAAAAVGMAATGSHNSTADGTTTTTPARRVMPLQEKLLPVFRSEAGVGPALSRRYPWLRYGENPAGKVQIVAGSVLSDSLEVLGTTGFPGERIMELASGARVLPWTPLFRRPTRVYAADRTIAPRAGRLFIKDEGSESELLYGNKIRKYEFLLPNLAYSGIRSLRTLGAYGSNHCAYLTLAAKYGHYHRAGNPAEMAVDLMLYPQPLSDNVLTKLRLLVASGAGLRFLDGDVSVGLSILGEELRTRSGAAGTTAYVPPGGSSPLSVLGHVEAVMELAEQIDSGDSPLTSPPDYIFVPLGSGATAMGLVLGCHLLGWPTTVVGTCSQDRGRLTRLVVNGDADTPFLVANAASLLDKSLQWADAMGLLPATGTRPSGHDLLHHSFACDSETWHPAYGKVTPAVARDADAAAASGLELDNTFSAKSFHTYREYAHRGLLDNKSALFWNTYQRYPLEKLLPRDTGWLSALPDRVAEQIDGYLKRQEGRIV